jgi:ATP-dependent 26S proteasome regulatory subunit
MIESTESLLDELTLNIRTNHPVSIIYTDDPVNTVDLVKSAIPRIRDSTDKILYWSPRNAWTDITPKDKSLAELIGNPTKIKVPDELSKTPLSYIFGSPDKIGARAPVFIMSLLSVQFKKDVMTIMQELRDFDFMVRNNVNNTYRLIVVANKSFEVPQDYENIFGIINHKLPTKAELRQTYRARFVQDYLDDLVKKVYDGDYPALRQQFVDLEDYVVNTLSGITERQFRLILFKAVSKNHTKKGKLVVEVDLEGFKTFLYEKKFEEVARSGIINLMKPIPMEKVGGLDNIKKWLVERKKAFTPEALEKGIKKPKGMCLVGPSGTGKSYIASATAGVLEFPCIQLNLSSIFNKYVGESESNMENMKMVIESMAPCVVFIDEIDKVFAGENRGSSGDSGVTSRILGKLLTWIQDTQSELFFVVTANRIQNIPAELLRKGRFDEIWAVTFPTSKERKAILDIHLKNRGYELKNINKAVTESSNFSSAELEHVVAEAILQAFYNDEKLSEKHLIDQIEATNPIADAFAQDIAYMKEWAEKHARPASIPEKYEVIKDDTI